MNLELHKSKNLLKILNTAIDAGKEIQKVYKKSFNVEIKGFFTILFYYLRHAGTYLKSIFLSN